MSYAPLLEAGTKLILAISSPLQEDGSDCSIFSFDIADNRSSLPLARNALKKLRTLRHPGVIKVLDTVEVRYLNENARIIGA